MTYKTLSTLTKEKSKGKRMTYLKKISVIAIIVAMASTAVFAEDNGKCDAKSTCSAEKSAACCGDTTKCGTDKCPKKMAKDGKACPADCKKECCSKDGKTCSADKAATCSADKAACESKDIKNEDIAATAGDVTITIEEVDELVAPRLQNMPEEVKANQSKLIKKRALDSLIFQKLLEKKFEENNITISDEQLDEEIEKILAENNITVEDFKKRVAEMGRDFNEFRDQVRSGMKYQKMMDKMAEGEIAIDDEQVKKYYEENPQRFQQESQVKASHILVKVAPDASEEDKAAAKKKLEDIQKKLEEGADFAELAKENSDCPSGSNGGDLGFFARGRMVKPFSDAAFNLKEGEVSDIVETQFGYHLIKLTDKKEAKTVTFEEAKEDIKNQLEDTNRREFAGKFREDLLKDADIVYYNEFKIEEKKPEAKKAEAVEIKPAE
jgi:peptidyl-prolyl cis-trans isomerase C